MGKHAKPTLSVGTAQHACRNHTFRMEIELVSHLDIYPYIAAGSVLDTSLQILFRAALLIAIF